MSATIAPPPPAAKADVLWFLPTHGDGRYLGSEAGARHVTLGYLSQIARAADELGYYGVLLPTGRSCEDSWVIASAMTPITKRLRFLVAVRPGLTEPAFAARMAATLDRLSDGRLLVNVVTGGDPVELKGDGVFLDHTERYALTDEFLSIWRKLMQGEEVTETHPHLQNRSGQAPLSSGSVPLSAALFRRIVGCGRRSRRQACRRLSDMGRASLGGRREARARQSRRGRARAHILVRDPPARDCPRDLRGRLEGGGRAHFEGRCGSDRNRAEGVRAHWTSSDRSG